jgi:phage head maturation protease
MNRPKPGQFEDRELSPSVEGRRIRGVIPYGVESRDLGGFREIIEPGALAGADLSELVATVNHQGVPLGRYPTTLSTEDRADGWHWSVDPPTSRVDIVEAIERGDIRSGSWRMQVAPGGDRWDGDVRRVHKIAALRDVSIATGTGEHYPAYQDAAVELRTHNPATGQEEVMATEAENTTETVEETATTTEASTEDRSTPTLRSAGGLKVEDRTSEKPSRGLAEEFRAAGFPGRPGELATIDFNPDHFEDRAVTWTGSVDNINKDRYAAGGFPYDQRWAWPAFTRVPVGYEVTSVDVLTQTARSLATAANVVRAIDAVTAKPETGSTLTIVTTSLKQVATIQTNIPNVYLAQPAFNTVVENDLRLAINDGLDKLILDYIAASGFQAPGTDPLIISIRKAVTTLWNAGYAPDTVLLTPAAAEALDVLVSGIASGVNDYVFSPAQFAPGTIFGMRRRISKTIPATAVVDSQALGKLYASPVTLARFEADAGTTNRSNVRMELNAVFGGERQAAAVRIAAS